MASGKRIGLREVRALTPGGIVWDGAVAGFGARRQRDSVAYILKYRTADGRQRWHTIGRHGAPWTPDEARDEARRVLGEVVKGTDPAAEKRAKRDALTVAELCQRYLADAEAGRVLVRGGTPKKPGTLEGDRGRIEGHIIPLLGRLSASAVTKPDVERFMHAVAAGETRREAKTKPRGVSRVRGDVAWQPGPSAYWAPYFPTRWTITCAPTTRLTGYGNTLRTSESGGCPTPNMRRLGNGCGRPRAQSGRRRSPALDFWP